MKVSQKTDYNAESAAAFIARAKAAKNQADADWFMRAAVRAADKAGTTVEAIEAAQAASVPACSYKAIRRFFAICKSAGIDTTNDSHMRGALSAFFGHRITTRRDLTTDMWLSAGDAIEARRLVF